MTIDMAALLAFCLDNIECDSCRCLGGRLRVDDTFTCDSCHSWCEEAITRFKSPPDAVD